MEENENKKNILSSVGLFGYTLGGILLLLVPSAIHQGLFLSPPSFNFLGTTPLFLSMLLLAGTSIIFVGAVFQKSRQMADADKFSKETKKIIEKNLENDVEKISESVLLRRDQAKKDFNKFVYLIGILSFALALFQAWEILFGNGSQVGSLIYWGAYLAIAAAWFGYGIYYQNKAIMITYGLWIFVEVTIINGILFYK